MFFTQKNFFYFFILFWINFSVMVFEILGSRILAPYIGTSLSVWTSIIGIILLFLSLGYYIGGILARKNYLGFILFSIAISFLYVFLLKDTLLIEMKEYLYYSKNIFAVISSIVLFGPISFLIALVSPIVTKKIIHLDKYLGEGLGKSYMIGALGGITGTFVTGFYLIPNFGVQKIILGLSISFAVLSFFFIKKIKIK